MQTITHILSLPVKNQNQIHALKTKLAGMRDDMLTKPSWTWAELAQQQAKIRALKSKITKLENAR